MEHPADAAYYRKLDQQERDDAHYDDCVTAIYSDLTVTGADVDAEFEATCNLDWAALRAAYLLMQNGDRDAALTAFADEFTRAANAFAEDNAADRMEYERRAADAENAAARAEYMEDR